MKLFSEIYSTYYHITEKILKKKIVTKADIQNIIQKYGFSESMLFLEPKLIQENGYGLLNKKNGIYNSILKKEPHIPLSNLEKKWLYATLCDKKSRLFLDKEQITEICSLLGEEPLYNQQDFCFFDRFLNGDNYEDEKYIYNFRNILFSIHNKTLIKISFNSRKGERITHYFLPVKLEYSSKNDCFRVYVIRYNKNKNKAIDNGIINLSNIIFTESTKITIDTNETYNDFNPRLEAKIKISNERNAVNRFMMEFAELERISEYDKNKKECFVKIKYDIKDETEILIRLLSFGPVLEVTEPESFRKKIQERVKKQFELLT